MPAGRKRSVIDDSVVHRLAKRFCIAVKSKPKPPKRKAELALSAAPKRKLRRDAPEKADGAKDEGPLPESEVGLADETAEQHYATHGGKDMRSQCARCKRFGCKRCGRLIHW